MTHPAVTNAVNESRIKNFVTSIAEGAKQSIGSTSQSFSNWAARTRNAFRLAPSDTERSRIIANAAVELKLLAGNDIGTFLGSAERSFGKSTPHQRYNEERAQGSQHLLSAIPSSVAISEAEGDKTPKYYTVGQLHAKAEALREKGVSKLTPEEQKHITEAKALRGKDVSKLTAEEHQFIQEADALREKGVSKLESKEKSLIEKSETLELMNKTLGRATADATADAELDKVDPSSSSYSKVGADPSNVISRKAMREKLLDADWEALKQLPAETSMDAAYAQLHRLSIRTSQFLDDTAKEQLEKEEKAISDFYDEAIKAVGEPAETPHHAFVDNLKSSGLLADGANNEAIKEKLKELKTKSLEATKANSEKALKKAKASAQYTKIQFFNQIKKRQTIDTWVSKLPKKKQAAVRKASDDRITAAKKAAGKAVEEKYKTQIEKAKAVTSTSVDEADFEATYGKETAKLIGDDSEHPISQDEAKTPATVVTKLEALRDREKKQAEDEAVLAGGGSLEVRGTTLTTATGADAEEARKARQIQLQDLLKASKVNKHGVDELSYGSLKFELIDRNDEAGTFGLRIRNFSKLSSSKQQEATEAMAAMMKAQGYTSCEWDATVDGVPPRNEQDVERVQAQTKRQFEADQRQGMKGSQFKSYYWDKGKPVACTYANPADFPDGKLPEDKGFRDINEIYAPEKAPQAQRSLEDNLGITSSEHRKAWLKDQKAQFQAELQADTQAISNPGSSAP